MDSAINEYQKWKQQGESLRAQAKQAMESRFAQLLNEAAQIAQEYQADFGSQLKAPAAITSFRYKRGVKAKKKAAAAPVAKPDAKVTGLERNLAQVRKKLEVAKAAGKSTKNLEDKIYEIEDELQQSRRA